MRTEEGTNEHSLAAEGDEQEREMPHIASWRGEGGGEREGGGGEAGVMLRRLV